MAKIIGKNFFHQPTLTATENLLGKYLVRKIYRKKIALIITEVEAYDGPRDRASHAARGQTPRNAPMFEEGGIWYIYFTYGMHWMLNIVTGPRRYPAAVLIRGAGEISGPARLTKFLKIDSRLNGAPAAKKSGLWIEDRGVKINPRDIKRTARIGVSYAGPVWSKKRYRLLLKTRGVR
jgi:DNA-3-methyladenine glycosylase